jgi:predicted nucleic acid-binding protein
VRFWDSSALVPLVTRESWSPRAEALLGEDPAIAAWWATPVECASAIVRKGSSGEAGTEDALRELADFSATWTEVPPSERLREAAIRAVRVHELRAGDALQLAAALIAAEERPETLDVVTLDERLALAAAREGFRVLPTSL